MLPIAQHVARKVRTTHPIVLRRPRTTRRPPSLRDGAQT